LARNQIKYQIITKSDLVVRDLDILKKSKCSVAITVTTLKEEVARKLEPNAPSPSRRIKALKKLHQNKIPTVARIDPIIPFLNDTEIETLVENLSFVDHIVASTFKPRYDSWRRFSKVFPDIAKKLRKHYFIDGEKRSNSWYLPKNMRFKLLSKVKQVAEDKGISFGSCRENFYSTKSCDGSHLILK
ncbi:MAG TPA: radical SAM protein, partial [Thermoplasmatales archaeon]|nr:radical SAM protein [Thermoplasmatales archaeon]